MSITSTTPLFKSLTMAEYCLLSSLFHSKPKPTFFSLPSKSINLHLSLKTNRSFSPLFVAQEGDTLTTSPDELNLDWEPTADAADDSAQVDYVEPSEDARIFVGNLPFDVDSENLATLFDQAGTVEIAQVIYNRETGQSRGFGFVTMSKVEEAESAIEKFNRYDYNGKSLTVNKASPKGSRPERAPRTFEPVMRIFVGNLPWEVDNSTLEQVFSEHGKVVSAKVVYDRETGRSRGFGFVTMSDETGMSGAVAALDGQSLEGRTIRVSVAEDRPRRSSF